MITTNTENNEQHFLVYGLPSVIRMQSDAKPPSVTTQFWLCAGGEYFDFTTSWSNAYQFSTASLAMQMAEKTNELSAGYCCAEDSFRVVRITIHTTKTVDETELSENSTRYRD